MYPLLFQMYIKLYIYHRGLHLLHSLRLSLSRATVTSVTTGGSWYIQVLKTGQLRLPERLDPLLVSLGVVVGRFGLLGVIEVSSEAGPTRLLVSLGVIVGR